MARAGDVRIIPDGLSFEEAATLPVVFMTSWHALKEVARLRKGEIVLVHAGAGGVGMAAIQIAHHLGAEVIASAGSPAKRALLEVLGVKHVIDSRRSDFAEDVMELTDGKGVDVVLNALSAEAIPMGLSCLAESGRFIEIGKLGIWTAEQIAAGTEAIVDLIRKRHPSTRILILRIFPRGGDSEQGFAARVFHSSPQCQETCRKAGALTAKLADGKHVFWLDVGSVFLRPDGTIEGLS